MNMMAAPVKSSPGGCTIWSKYLPSDTVPEITTSPIMAETMVPSGAVASSTMAVPANLARGGAWASVTAGMARNSATIVSSTRILDFFIDNSL